MSKILLSLPDSLLQKLDTYCLENDFERSEFVRTLVRRGLQMREALDNDLLNTQQVRKNIKNVQKDPLNLDRPNPQIISALPTSSSNMGLWRCKHGNIGKLCKDGACRISARSYEK